LNNAIGSVTNISVREVTASDHGGLINGADYVDAQPRIPQLGMMNWSKGSNLYLNSEPTSNEAAAGDITYASYSWNYIGFKNATVFGDNSSTRFRYGGSVTSGLEYTLSAFVIMDDNSEPDITNSSSSGDFGIVLGNAVTGGTNTKTNVSGNIWRVSKTKTVSSTTTNNGIIKYSTQSSKGFNVVGWQLEESSSVGAYRLTDGGATLNSTVIANPTIPTKDIFGNLVRDRLNSFNLDGSGYSSVANNSSIKPTSALSVECWIKTSDVSSASKYISDADVGVTRFFLMQVGSKARFKIATTEIDSAANLTDNTWHYIAGTWNGSTMTLYVDEETPVTISKSGAITYDTDDLFIGSRLGTGEYFDGLISDVRLYDRELTSDEVENNYNAGLSAHTNN